ncbi:MAG: hypothetical protein NC293_09790 [Roseburia sp.]|nr:hypothetical protein [Roseburia sp.]
MYTMDVHVMGLDELKWRLGKLAPEAKNVMRMSVNDTAVKARKMLNDKARERYAVKKTKFNKALKLTRASNATLTAVLHAKGSPLPLSYFEIRKNGKRKAGQGHQLQSTSPTPISKETGKTFVIRVRRGDQESSHRGLFYRETEERFPLLQVYGSSIPSMLGSQGVYGELQSVIEDELGTNLQRHIDLVLRRI